MVRFRPIRLARPLATLLLLFAAGVPTVVHGQSILTVAGGGNDDGRLATAVRLQSPAGVVRRTDGTIYFTDLSAQKVRKVDGTTGLIGTLAGTGLASYSGDGGPAERAALHSPYALFDDGRGGLVFSDINNHRLRRIDLASGRIETVAGGGAPPDGTGDGLPATQARLSLPRGLARDGAGNLYVTEGGSVRVRRIDAVTGLVSTVAGSGASGFSGDGGPATLARFDNIPGIASDLAGNLFIADNGNRRIRRVDAVTHVVTTVAGNGTSTVQEGAAATSSGLWSPLSVTVGPGGDFYIGDVGAVRRVSASTGRMESVATFVNPFALAFDGPTRLLVAEGAADGAGIYLLDLSTSTKTVLAGGSATAFGDGGPATAEVLVSPIDAVPASNGDLFVTESGGGRVRKVSRSTGTITTVAGTGHLGSPSPDGTPATSAILSAPRRTALDRSGNIFVTDYGAGRVFRIDAVSGLLTTFAGSPGGPTGDGVPATSAHLGSIEGLAVDSDGSVFVTQLFASRVRKVDAATGLIRTVAGTGENGFSGDGGPATLARLADPYDVTLDTQRALLIADTVNGRVRRVDPATGTITTVAGGGALTPDVPLVPTQAALPALTGVAVGSRGELFIAANFRVVRVDPATGLLGPFAGTNPFTGTGLVGSTGDGGPATRATFASVMSVHVDREGNVFIADPQSNRIRAVFACVTVAAPGLSAPSDGATGVSTGPTLSWSKVSGAFRYDVLLGTSSVPTTVVASDLEATSFTPLNLSPGTRYFWRVVAKGDPFCVPPSTAASPVRSFTTETGCAPPSAPALVAPADGAVDVASPVVLSWNPVPGAGSYDVCLGATNAPPLGAVGGSSTTFTASGLAPGGVYYWSVVARAACDATKSATSTVRSFRVAGAGCPPPGAFSASSPANGETGLPPDVTLSWTASPNATSYDLYLGLGGSLPLYLAGLTTRSITVRGLTSGGTYRWKVVARTSCAPGATAEVAVRSFTVRGLCSTPAATSFSFLPPGAVGSGQTYVVAWHVAADLDAGGGYVVERSASTSFSPILDVVPTNSLFASFVAPGPGSLYHRVRAVPACDPSRTSPWSPTGVVTVVAARPNVVFSRSPDAVVAGLGERLEDVKTTFALENVTSSPLQVIVSRQELSSVPFFTIVDPAGGDAAFVTLEPRVPRLFEVRYSGPGTTAAGSYQGLIVVSSTGAGLAVTPYAFVSLKVGSSPDAVPEFRVGGVATEYAAFPGFSGDDSSRPPLSVDVRNPGSSPLELAAEVGPEVWLWLEPGWNSTPIPAGASRTLRLSTRRVRAPNGSALPRYTYLTLRTKGGKTARLLVQDNDAPLLSSGRGASAVRPEASYLVPSVAHVTSALGNTFVSRLSLSNAGTEPVQAELVFTPASSDAALVDGFDAAAIRRATVVVPPNDLVRLSDPLVLLFGLTPPVSGTLEVRAPSARAGFLSVASSVDAPSSKGGSFGFALPVFRSGEGIRAGSSAAITAVASDATERTNLILAETTGVDAAVAKVSLVDREGTPLGSETVTVPRWGQRQLSKVLERLGGAFGSRAARLEVSVESGGGTLAAVTTVVDNANDDAAAFAARAVSSSGSTLRTLRPAWARAGGTVKSLVPSIVNGYQTFPSSAAPFTFRSVMGFSSLSTAEALFRLTYFDLASGATIARELRVPGRKTVEYANVLEQLFGVGTGARSQGPLFVESDPNGILWCRVASSLVEGTIGDSFPVVPVPSEGLTGAGSSRVVELDGLEQSVDRTRGTRSNLILNEVAGRPVTLLVSLYEAGNRSSPIAEREVSLKALEKVQLSTVFSELGLDSDARRKDRTNVLCTVRAKSGDGLASALVTTIDNRTGDTRNILLAPSGAGAGGVSIGF